MPSFNSGEQDTLKYLRAGIMNVKNEFGNLKSESITQNNSDNGGTYFQSSENISGSSDNSSSYSNGNSRSNQVVRTIGSRSGFIGKAPSSTIDTSQTGVYNYNDMNDDFTYTNNSNNSGTSFVLALSVTFALVALIAIFALCIINFIYI